jgi:hypothetical protein
MPSIHIAEIWRLSEGTNDAMPLAGMRRLNGTHESNLLQNDT